MSASRCNQNEGDHPRAVHQQDNEAQTGAWIPRRDAEMSVWVDDEAQPIEQRVGRQIREADNDFVRVENAGKNHRPKPVCLNLRVHEPLAPFAPQSPR